MTPAALAHYHSHKEYGVAEKSPLIRNIEALLAKEEPNERRWASMLSELLGVDRTTGHRILTKGTNSIEVLQKIANALFVNPSSLVDPNLVGRITIDARMLIDEIDFPVKAWIEPIPEPPWKIHSLVAWQEEEQWRIGQYAKNHHAEVHRVAHIECNSDPLPLTECRVGILVEGDLTFADVISESLAKHGFDTYAFERETEIEEISSRKKFDAIIIDSINWENSVERIRDASQKHMPSIILSSNEEPWADLYAGNISSGRTAFEILVTLRQIVSFSKPL